MTPNPDEWSAGAVAVVTADGETTVRPVAFVFKLAGGIVAWVEPSYADPVGAGSPALHFADDEGADPSGAGIRCRGPGWTADLLPYDAADHRDLIGDALEWFADWLKVERRSWADERARVAAMVV